MVGVATSYGGSPETEGRLSGGPESAAAMRRIKMVVEYDGTGFQGFQENSIRGTRTIQGELQAKLSQLLARPVKTVCAGRTDAGVHASGQVITFDTDSDRSLRDLLRGANAVLCEQVRVVSVDEVSRDFHPRFSAQSRIYHYYLAVNRGKDPPFLPHRIWYHRGPLDLELMQQAADRLVGSHDFSAYCRGVPEHEPRRRDLQRLQVVSCPVHLSGPFGRPLDTLVRVEVQANAFLRRMVRMLVGNLAAVGCGEWDVDEPFRVLESLDPTRGAASAPPHGLYLVEVVY